MAWQRSGARFGNVITNTVTAERDAFRAPGRTIHAIKNSSEDCMSVWAQTTNAKPGSYTCSAMTGRAAIQIPG